MSGQSWTTLGTPVTGAEAPTGDYAFLQDPLAELSDEQRRDLRDDLADMTRRRREAESEGSTLRLA